MISWQLMNFSQTESKVRFQCGAQIHTQERPGAKRGLHPAIRPPFLAHESPSPGRFSTGILLSVQRHVWWGHGERRLGAPHPEAR